MDRAVLLAQLRSMLESTPDFGTYSPTSEQHQAWLAGTHALIGRWSPIQAINFASAGDSMHMDLLRDSRIAKVMGILHRAIADLELDTPKLADQAFGPGSEYDFFKSLTAAVKSAQKSLFILDPYLDDNIFDTYLSGTPSGIAVRLLARNFGKRLKPAVQKFVGQHGISVEVRVSGAFHDRLLFVDNLSCWIMGQSITDAAKKKPTYLVPLAPDIAKLKLDVYEDIWLKGTVL